MIAPPSFERLCAAIGAESCAGLTGDRSPPIAPRSVVPSAAVLLLLFLLFLLLLLLLLPAPPLPPPIASLLIVERRPPMVLGLRVPPPALALLST